MPEFLAETYTPRDAPGTAAPAPGDLARAAAHAGRPGAPAHFLGAILVPGEETGFWLYQAPTAEAVHAAMAAAGLRPERITPAETLWPPRRVRPVQAPHDPRPAHRPTGAETFKFTKEERTS